MGTQEFLAQILTRFLSNLSQNREEVEWVNLKNHSFLLKKICG